MTTVSIILKVVDYCNFNCSFCRYTLQKNTSPLKMTSSLAEECLRKGALYNIESGNSYIHIIFHGGEPLLWGYDNFKKIFKFEDDFKKEYPDFIFYNSIQTNGSLLTPQLLNLFIKYNVSIGISIDGPEKINYHKPDGDYDGILSKLEMLNNSNCNYGILSVITNSHKNKAIDYYKFIIDNQIKSVGLCYCFDPIGNASVDNEVLSDFLIELFDLYFFGSYKMRIREFDSVIEKYLGLCSSNCNFRCREKCGDYFSIFPDGKILFCDSYEYKSEPLGNIMAANFNDIKKTDKYKNIISDLSKNFESNCKNCSILHLCGGGCFRNDMINGKNYFCKAYEKTYMHIANVINQFRKEEQANERIGCN